MQRPSERETRIYFQGFRMGLCVGILLGLGIALVMALMNGQ